MGMELERWTYESCTADIAVGDSWATIYQVNSREESKGHASTLLRIAKTFYETTGKRFGGSVALNDRMRKLYERLGITEYDGGDDGE